MTDVSSILPMVSVILPVRGEGRAFAHTLARIEQQDYPADRMEILVVDGMSEDATREVVREVSARDPRFRLLDNPGRIVPTAMNVGIAAARGEVIVRIDGHTLVERNYVTRCVEALRASGADCVGGLMTPRGDTFFGRLVASATSGPFGVGNSHFHYSERPMFTESVYMGAWPKQVLVGIGGFDEEMVRNQDDELNYRLRKGGGRVWLDPSIRSEYKPRGSLKKLFKQYFQYGYWKVRVFQKHPAMLRPRHFVPAAFVLAGTILFVLALAAGPWAALAFAAGVALYLGAGWVAAMKSPGTPRGRWAMPLVFLTMHAAYGTGFLAGFARFLPRWLDRAPSASTPR